MSKFPTNINGQVFKGSCACTRMSCKAEGTVGTQATRPAGLNQAYWKGIQLWQSSDIHKNTHPCCQGQEHQLLQGQEHELCLGGLCPLALRQAGSLKAEILIALEHLPHLFLSFAQTYHTRHLQARKTEVIATNSGSVQSLSFSTTKTG